MNPLHSSYNESHTAFSANTGIVPVPKDQRPDKHKITSVISILTSVLLERIAYYTLVSQLLPTLQNSQTLNWSSGYSILVLFLFEGLAYISTLIFATISDARLGRAKTIFFGFFLYVVGYILITIIANGQTGLCEVNNQSNDHYEILPKSNQRNQCYPAIVSALVVTAIGAGAVKSSIAVLGAEQVHQTKFIAQYFDYYYCVVNVGSAAGMSLLILTTPDSTKFFTVYLIATIVLVFSAISFVLGLWYCRHTKPSNTVVTECFPVFWYALRRWFKADRHRRQGFSNENSMDSLVAHESSSLISYEQPRSFLDYAKNRYQGPFIDRNVDDVKTLAKAAIVFLLLIPYWLVYSQKSSTFVQQGKYMKGYTDRANVYISLVDPVSVIVTIPILNIFVYPRIKPRIRSKIITVKLITGMVLAALSMITAGVIEIQRQNDNQSKNISDLSIYAQIPQNVLLGSAEAFTTTASFEFAYFAAPISGQSLFMSLHFCSAGVASFLGPAFIAMFSSDTQNKTIDFDFYCSQSSCPKLFGYFFFLAALPLPFIFIIYYAQKKHELIQMHRQQTDSMG